MLILCLVLVGLPRALSQQCANTGFGTSSEREFPVSTESRLYLNTGNPAECAGTISAYRFCHYPTLSIQSYNARVGVYRLVNSTDYQLLDSTDIRLQIGANQSFSCANTELSAGVQVEPGDVIGACVGNPDGGGADRERLDIVGNAAGYNLQGVALTCSVSQLQASIQIGSLSTHTSRILHVSAEIVPGSEPPTTPTEGVGGGGSNAVGIGLGVVLALLFLAIVITVVIVVVIVVLRRNGQLYSVTKKESNLTQGMGAGPSQVHEIAVTSNDAYGQTIVTETFSVDPNEAYQMSNSARQTTEASGDNDIEYETIPKQCWDSEPEYDYVEP